MDNKSKILGEIAKTNLVEEVARKTIKGYESEQNIQDLCQDIYLLLLEKDHELIEHLWNEGQMKFYIARIVANQFFSKNSPYYMKYKKFDRITSEINYSDSDDEE